MLALELPPGDEAAGLEPLPAGCEVSELEQPAVASRVTAATAHIGAVHQRLSILIHPPIDQGGRSALAKTGDGRSRAGLSEPPFLRGQVS
ncbi:hypothetical protein [Jatrophihabitans sp.]|uniref:hypothetical protein n=1 Tax=Jatrophihabitans sp. TaxID=1932789 RepID=UPI0038CD75E0